MNDKVKEAIRLIRQGEGQYVEFKKKANHPEKIVREVVAFANTEGGHLFIGVDDDGNISGLKYPEDEEFILSKAIRELARPAIDFEVALVKVREDVQILHYVIEEGKQKPYFSFLHKKHRTGRSFIRVDDQSIQASYEMRQILKREDASSMPIVYEEKVDVLFKYFNNHSGITLTKYMEISGLDKKLASNKLINLALSGALKIQPREGEDVFLPVD